MSDSKHEVESTTYGSLNRVASSGAPPEIFIDEDSGRQAEDIAARVKAVMATIPKSPVSMKRRMDTIRRGISTGAAAVATQPPQPAPPERVSSESDEWERVRMRRSQMVDSLCSCAHKQQAKTEKARIKYQRLVKKVTTTTVEEYYTNDCKQPTTNDHERS